MSAKEPRELWVWVKVPLRVIERAIAALKDAAIRAHWLGSHAEGDADDDAADTLKDAVRKDEHPDK